MKDSDSKAKTLTPAGRKVWASKDGQAVLTAALNGRPQNPASLNRVRKQLSLLDAQPKK